MATGMGWTSASWAREPTRSSSSTTTSSCRARAPLRPSGSGSLAVAGDQKEQQEDKDGNHRHGGVEEEAAQGGRLPLLPVGLGGAGGETDLLLIPEVVGELGCTGVAGAGIALQRTVEDLLHLRRDGGVELAW